MQEQVHGGRHKEGLRWRVTSGAVEQSTHMHARTNSRGTHKWSTKKKQADMDSQVVRGAVAVCAPRGDHREDVVVPAPSERCVCIFACVCFDEDDDACERFVVDVCLCFAVDLPASKSVRGKLTHPAWRRGETGGAGT